MDGTKIREMLLDAGCGTESADKILRMYEEGHFSDALQSIKKDRCRLMDAYHDIGRKVDIIDSLIKTAEKEITKYEGL